MSIAAVQARIAEIQARLAPPPSTTGAANFDAVLNAAVAKTSGTSMAAAPATPGAAIPWAPGPFTGSTGSAVGALQTSGPLQPPADLRAYGNGRIPPTALAEIGVGSHRMSAPAAASFKQMLADARSAGVNFGVTDSYRSYEAQVDLAERKGLYSQGGLAAKPGTSNHGWGLSLDLDLDATAQQWMRDNGKKYGFVEDVPREPWHWTYRAG